MLNFKINNADFSQYVRGLSTGYETVLSGASGQNARGNTIVDIINKKKAVSVSFIPLEEETMEQILTAIDPYTLNLTYSDPKTGVTETITTHVSNPSVTFLMNTDNRILYDGFDLTFNEI